jgi:hypothetical protein
MGVETHFFYGLLIYPVTSIYWRILIRLREGPPYEKLHGTTVMNEQTGRIEGKIWVTNLLTGQQTELKQLPQPVDMLRNSVLIFLFLVGWAILPSWIYAGFLFAKKARIGLGDVPYAGPYTGLLAILHYYYIPFWFFAVIGLFFYAKYRAESARRLSEQYYRTNSKNE